MNDEKPWGLEDSIIADHTTLDAKGQSGIVKPRPKRTKHQGLLGPSTVALYIDELDDPLVFQITNQLILGRVSSRSGVQPQIDLGLYHAFERGVSRLHAVIQRSGNDLFFEDLGSSNGSFINNECVVPHSPRKLVSGDFIRLGQLTLDIFFHLASSSDTAPPTVLLPENEFEDGSGAQSTVLMSPQVSNMDERLPSHSSYSPANRDQPGVALPAIRGMIDIQSDNSDDRMNLAGEMVIGFQNGPEQEAQITMEITISGVDALRSETVKQLLAKKYAQPFSEFMLSLK